MTTSCLSRRRRRPVSAGKVVAADFRTHALRTIANVSSNARVVGWLRDGTLVLTDHVTQWRTGMLYTVSSAGHVTPLFVLPPGCHANFIDRSGSRVSCTQNMTFGDVWLAGAAR